MMMTVISCYKYNQHRHLGAKGQSILNQAILGLYKGIIAIKYNYKYTLQQSALPLPLQIVTDKKRRRAMRTRVMHVQVISLAGRQVVKDVDYYMAAIYGKHTHTYTHLYRRFFSAFVSYVS